MHKAKELTQCDVKMLLELLEHLLHSVRESIGCTAVVMCEHYAGILGILRSNTTTLLIPRLKVNTQYKHDTLLRITINVSFQCFNFLAKITHYDYRVFFAKNSSKIEIFF